MKKFISVLIAVCMLMQILPVFAFAEDTATSLAASDEIVYILNDEFAENDLNGWEFKGTASDVKYAVTVPVEEGSDNYALKYAADDNGYSTYVTKTLENSVVFEETKDVVIEMKVKQTNTGRSYLKYNLVRDGGWSEWNYGWGTLIVNDNGLVTVPDGWNQYMYPVEVTSNATNKWYDVKVTIHGKTKTASYVMTDAETGEIFEVNETSIANPASASWVEDALNSLEFTLRNAQELYVDYIRVYEVYKNDMVLDISYLADKPIEVKFNYSGNFENAVSLYDLDGNLIEAVNSINEEQNVVTITPTEALVAGNTYKVVIDETLVPVAHSFEITEKTFLASDIKYLVLDEFAENDLSGWEFVGTASDVKYAVTVPVEEGSDNYALKYAADDNGYSTYVTRALEESIALEEGKDVVIEMKVKQTNTGRSYLKYNLVRDGGWSEWNYGWGTLIVNDNGLVTVPDGWSSYMYPVEVTSNATNKWYDVKVTIHGNTKTASYVMTDAETGEIFEVYETNIANPASASWVEDALNSLEFTLRNAQELYVDYVKVYEVTKVEMFVDFNYVANQPITINFSHSGDFVNTVKLYDDNGDEVETVNVVNEDLNAVTITPATDLVAGEYYMVRIDEDSVPGNYIFDEAKKRFLATDRKYYILDEFEENDLNGWVMTGTPKDAVNTYLTTVADGEEGNYVLEYKSASSTDSFNTFITKTLDKPVAFEAGKNIVIETKMKSAETTVRSMLKYNLVRDGAWNEYNYEWGSLLTIDASKIYVPEKWNTYITGKNVAETTTLDKWFDVKVVIYGDSKKVSYVVTDLSDGTVYKTETVIDHPDTANWAEDVINTLNFTFKGSNQTLKVDYVKVYEVNAAEMTVDFSYVANKPVTVTFNHSGNFKDIVSIYDLEGNKVEAVNSINEENNAVTITPIEALVIGNTYKIVIDEALVPASYNFAETEKTFLVADKKYFVYDEFAENDLSGWVMTGTPKDAVNTYLTTVADGEEGNYVLEYKSASSTDSFNTFITKALDNSIAFENGKNVVIETKMKSAETTVRSMLKYNLVRDGGWSEYNYEWGSLLTIDASKIYVPDKWNGYLTGKNVAETTTLDKWFDVKVVIYGDSKKVSYVVTDLSDGTVYKTETVIDHPDTANWAEDVINTLNFTFKGSNQTLKVDYVKAYITEQTELGFTLKNGRYSEYNKGIELVVSSEEDVVIPDGTATLKDASGNEVATSISYDKETNIVTVTPKANLTIGDVYTLTINENECVTNKKGYQTTFEIVAKEAYTDGYTLFDNFDNDTVTDNKTASGWYLGTVANEEAEGSISIVEKEGATGKALKLSGNVSHASENGEQTVLAKKLGGGIKYKEGSTVTVRTRIKYEGDGRILFCENRPDSLNLPTYVLPNNLYNLFMVTTESITSHDGIAGVENSSVAKLAEGNHTNKWIDFTLVIDGANQTLTTTMFIEGESAAVTKTSSLKRPQKVFDNYYGKGTEKSSFDVLEMLSFTYRDAGGDLYVDYIEVFETPDTEAKAFLCDANGNDVAVITDGATIYPSFDFYYPNHNGYVAISAIYENGILVDTHIQPINAGVTRYTDSVGYKVGDATNVVIKAFVWNSLDKMTPIGGVTSVYGDVVDSLLTLYVDAEDGDDVMGTGESFSPVSGISKALDIAKNASGYEEVKIVVGGGNYYLDEMITIDTTNHKTDKLTITAARGENPTIVNGKSISLKNAQKVENSDIISRLAEPTAANYLYQISLAEFDIPEINLPGTYSYTAHGLATSNGTFEIEETQKATCEIFFNNKPLIVARYPNEGYLNIEKGFTEGAVTRYWLDDAGEDFVPQENRVATPFTIVNERATKWTKATDALMFGYWKHNWATQTVPIGSISGTTITSKYPSHYGIGEGKRYYVYNLLEEIDAPGEYYIDRENKMLYFYLPEGASVGAASNDEFFISLNDEKDTEMMFINANNVVIEGIDFTVSRVPAFKVFGAFTNINNCEISNIATMAVSVYSTNNVIENCYIHDVNGGIAVTAGNAANFRDAKNVVKNNTIERFSRFSKVYTYAISLHGSGSTATDNKISEGEHSAIHFTGTNHMIARNDISNVCLESDDAGAIYVGRTWTSRNNKIVNNYIHDLYSSVENIGIAGVFFDDHYAGGHIEGNVFENIGGKGVHICNGRENTVINNVFINCEKSGAVLTAMGVLAKPSLYTTHIKDAQKYVGNALWLEKYPIMFNEDGTELNVDELIWDKHNVMENNYAYNCGEIAYNIGNYIREFGSISETTNVVGTNDLHIGSKSEITSADTGISAFMRIPIGEIIK